VPSSSRITPNLILHAFKKGADLVILGDCPSASSLFPWSKDVAEQSIAHAKARLAEAGIADERIFFSEFTTGDLQKFIALITDLSAKVKAAEPITDQQRSEL